MLQCPHCSAAVTPAAPPINIVTCRCGKLLRIRDENWVSLDKIPVLENVPVNLSIGTAGIYEGNKFRVTGRFFVRTDDSVFNYWTIVFDNGNWAYLAEGYGGFCILKKTDAAQGLLSNKIDVMQPGFIIPLLDDQPFHLQRIENKVSLSIEGDIVFPEIIGSFRLLDFYSEQGNFMTVFECGKDIISYYETVYCSFDSLGLVIPPKNISPRNYHCQACSKPMPVLAAPYSISVTCKHCGQHHRFEEHNGNLIKSGRNEGDPDPYIEVGSRGILKGVEYDVIGYSYKQELNEEAACWREYALYNQKTGFSFLSEFDGHWIFVIETPKAPLVGPLKLNYFRNNGEEYSLFNQYGYKVVNAIGEHPYNITATADTLVKEFIAPPHVWYVEKSKQHIDWFFGEHVEERTVYDSFKFPGSTPVKQGVGMVEPKGAIDRGKLFKTTLICCVLLFLVHLLTSFSRESKTLHSGTYFFEDTATTFKVVTEKFNLDKWRSNLSFHISAPVDNNWLEMQASLVNTDDGKEYSISKGVEYYSGYTDGESWSEGSRNDDAYLTGIPQGNYVITITGTRDASSFNRPGNFGVTVLYDVSFMRNFLFCMLMIIGMAIIQYMIFVHYDKQRWYNSPFTKYNYDES